MAYNISRPLGVIFGPPVLIGVSYTYWSKRRCYQWKQELADDDFALYPKITPDLNKYVRKLSDPSHGMQPMENPKENPGLVVREGFLTEEEIKLLKDLLSDLCDEFGLPVPQEGIDKMRKYLTDCNLPTDFLEKVRYVSDRYECADEPRARWGCGDSLRLFKLPLSLRALNHKLHAMLPHLGELRHIYIERSPVAASDPDSSDVHFLRTPKPQRAFDGHEYIIIPLFEDKIHQTREEAATMADKEEMLKHPGGAVITFSPTKRDRTTDSRVSLMEGFSSADLDVFCPLGSCLQVRGSARFKYAWGVRPGQPYFGNPQNPLPLGPNFQTLNPGKVANSHLLKDLPDSSRIVRNNNNSNSSGGFSSFGSTLWSNLFAFSLPWFNSNSNNSDIAKNSGVDINNNNNKNNTNSILGELATKKKQKSQDVLVLCYEGPFSEQKQRQKATMFEYDCYGEPPKPEHFEWAPDVPPSAEELRQEGLLWWMLKNYPKLFNPTP